MTTDWAATGAAIAAAGGTLVLAGATFSLGKKTKKLGDEAREDRGLTWRPVVSLEPGFVLPPGKRVGATNVGGGPALHCRVLGQAYGTAEGLTFSWPLDIGAGASGQLRLTAFPGQNREGWSRLLGVSPPTAKDSPGVVAALFYIDLLGRRYRVRMERTRVLAVIIHPAEVWRPADGDPPYWATAPELEWPD